MDRKEWSERIKGACKDAGTYRTYFDSAIQILAETLEMRDDALKQFRDEGSIAVIQYTNKGGATNTVKNPLLLIIDDLSKTALAYWRDLGLTPAGLKRIGDGSLKADSKPTLSAVLKDIGV